MGLLVVLFLLLLLGLVLVFFGFVGFVVVVVFSLMGNFEKEGAFGGEFVIPENKTVLWPWCAPLLRQVYFVGLILCKFYSPCWGFQYLFIVFLFEILLSSESLGMDESRLHNKG